MPPPGAVYRHCPRHTGGGEFPLINPREAEYAYWDEHCQSPGFALERYIHDMARMAEELRFDSVWIPDRAVVPRAVEARYGPVYYDAVAVLGYRGYYQACAPGHHSVSHSLPSSRCAHERTDQY